MEVGKENRNIPLFKVFMPPETMEMMEETLQSGFLAEGNKVRAFRDEIAKFIGNDRVVPVNSCTMGLTIAFKLAGVGPGTEVISTALTCVAGNEPVQMLGGKVVWSDVDLETGMVTADLIEPLISPRTKAIYVLHKEGAPADIEAIYDLAKSRGLKVIEDAAHAFGARRRDWKIGAKGDFVVFSFQAIKHITTGDGGALLCANEEDFRRAKKAKWFGIDRDAREGRDVWREDIPEWGFKGNMNDIAGTLGLAQIRHVDWILEKFHQNGRRYDRELAGIPGVGLLKRDPNDFQTYWGYTVLVENRDAVIAAMTEAGIGASQIHVRNDCYSMFDADRRDLPNTDWFDAREVSIPCGWWVDQNDQDYIIEILKKAVQ
ncbi:dTDP-4-amino-4,6-dideoxygalactose transaminase [Aestuariispira insulae]|uniref:dTDP-4-amino-4,6-dideoxygalactose transaminase n=1 Tax=Aestuariispira insulae TaxID=1461337 RepID=A0A3D9H4B7_9PROT|nr:dTDP-4-amino-4,6-dideoxygalactose transaminase [Aestuariispira insulae]